MESDSILNQQNLIEDYCARHPEFVPVEHYSDDGYTGTNFNRPAFQRMISDIEAGKINCVIVKDLSRFGQDYIDMGYYLERYFEMCENSCLPNEMKDRLKALIQSACPS